MKLLHLAFQIPSSLENITVKYNGCYFNWVHGAVKAPVGNIFAMNFILGDDTNTQEGARDEKTERSWPASPICQIDKVFRR